MVLGGLIFISSCGSDDGGGIIIDDDGGLLVADGFYPVKTGEDPVAIQQMTSASVDGPDITAIDRDGFYQAYAYLTAGSYNIVEVEDGEIINTLGGSASQIEGEDGTGADGVNRNMECDATDSEFTLVTAAVDGASFSIPADGLYVIAYDVTSSEIVFDQLTTVGVIGAATPGGWGSDTQFTGTVTADGGTWSIEEMALEEDEWKFRFNCRWAIDRRNDATQAFGNENGYSFFTNFGGSLSTLVPGNEGSNIVNDARGEYTITLNWDPSAGFSATATKTGDLVPLPDFPEAMYLTGAASTYDWHNPSDNPDAIMHKIAGGTPGVYWKIAHLTGSTGFKLSGADYSSYNLGFGDIDSYDAEGVTVTEDGGNMSVGADGVYMIVIDFRDDMTKVSIKEAEVYGMGDTFGGFNEDEAANLFTIDVAAMTVTSPALSAAGDIRMYANHAWIPDWWNAEFIVIDGVLEYRNDGGDQARVAGTVGQVITLSFDDNTGTIE